MLTTRDTNTVTVKEASTGRKGRRTDEEEVDTIQLTEYGGLHDRRQGKQITSIVVVVAVTSLSAQHDLLLYAYILYM